MTEAKSRYAYLLVVVVADGGGDRHVGRVVTVPALGQHAEDTAARRPVGESQARQWLGVHIGWDLLARESEHGGRDVAPLGQLFGHQALAGVGALPRQRDRGSPPDASPATDALDGRHLAVELAESSSQALMAGNQARRQVGV